MSISVESVLRKQISSYLTAKDGSFPEWFMVLLERASVSDKIQMLRDRGIWELPIQQKEE